MITAVDANIFLDILLPNEKFVAVSSNALRNVATDGSIVICDIVYAELSVHFAAQKECDEFLGENDIRVEALTRASHFAASRVWREYRKQGGQRTRILADFLIGAHAQQQCNRLLSRDRGFYRKLFPKLTLIDPTRQTAKEVF